MYMPCKERKTLFCVLFFICWIRSVSCWSVWIYCSFPLFFPVLVLFFNRLLYSFALSHFPYFHARIQFAPCIFFKFFFQFQTVVSLLPVHSNVTYKTYTAWQMTQWARRMILKFNSIRNCVFRCDIYVRVWLYLIYKCMRVFEVYTVYYFICARTKIQQKRLAVIANYRNSTKCRVLILDFCAGRISLRAMA